ncbi:MAG TPA: PQQ-dependent sugar dehydrogenase [Thermoanaerobaculia bacterium]|nr:PQQ-dependent sugar dehydrogenase [Thermoanaerobaculia bacterium]
MSKQSIRAILVTLLILAAGEVRAAVPTGFTDALVTNVGAPTALAFTPDGRLLITTQGGSLRVYQGSALLATPALTIPANRLCNSSEQGLLGIAVDPAFASNGFIYLFYTFERPSPPGGCVNRVSRFTLPANNVINSITELVMVDNMPSPAGNHNAGDVQFGRDGYLYISIGDGGCDYANDSGCAESNDAARDEHVLTGKILRITKDGGIPPSNPFQGAGTARCNVGGSTTPGNKCQETFAWGLRNPFRMAFDPNAAGTRFFINDVGQGAWEEIDLGQAGADYGWNCREGAHPRNTSGPCNPAPPNMVDPIHEYSHNTGCGSITGGAFVPNGTWPAAYDNGYLFSDYVCGRIFKLTPAAGGGYTATDFATGLGSSSAVHLTFGPFGNAQALYYTTYAGGGQVRRISYNVPGTNNAPTAVASASPTSGSAPLTVTFNASGSSDPDTGNSLTYFWSFGDGTPEVSTTSLTINHTYASAGNYTATLRARDNNLAFSSPVTVQIQSGNTPPAPVISSPAAGALFRVGQSVTLSGSASDAQDGTLPASRLSWTVVLHHDTHTHPFFGPAAGNNVTFTTPAPEDLAAAANSYLEVRLTATDSQGLSSTVTRDFQPRKVNVTFATAPAGLQVTVNGTTLTGPQTVISWDGYRLNAVAPTQDAAGQTWVFASWSDGGAASHAIVTPASPATYTATFEASDASIPLDFHTVTPCRVVDTRDPAGPLGGPALASGSTRTFDVAGACGIPASAAALAVNVTVIAPTRSGYIQLFPAGLSASGTSTVNFAAGQTRANNAIVSLGSNGFSATCAMGGAGSAHLLVDVYGYFE